MQDCGPRPYPHSHHRHDPVVRGRGVSTRGRSVQCPANESDIERSNYLMSLCVALCQVLIT